MALKQAKAAFNEDEVPVGAVLVKDGDLIDSAYNLSKAKNNPLFHTEMILINRAFENDQIHSLKGFELYVTLEPCPMCAGAIVASGISKVVFGAYDFDYGGFGGFVNLKQHPFARNLEIYGGILESECSELLRNFFKERR